MKAGKPDIVWLPVTPGGEVKITRVWENELVLMLECAGFNNIQIFGDFSDEQANADHNTLEFVCKETTKI